MLKTKSKYDLEAIKVLLDASGLSQADVMRKLALFGFKPSCNQGCQDGCEKSCAPRCVSCKNGGSQGVAMPDVGKTDQIA